MMFWTKIKDEIEQQLQDLHLRVGKIISSPATMRVDLKSYKDIYCFAKEKFPEIRFEDIPIYITESNVLKKHGFQGCNGCYVPSMDLILIRSLPNVTSGNPKSVFFKHLHKSVKNPISRSDVVLHELMHAVSKRIERTNRRFTNDEEEFVYSNCIDFYKSKWNWPVMSDDDIVKIILRSFCLNDILEDKTKLSKSFEKLRVKNNIDTIPWMIPYTKDELNGFMDSWAPDLVDIILNESEEEGYRILEFSRSDKRAAPKKIDLSDPSERFDFLNFD